MMRKVTTLLVILLFGVTALSQKVDMDIFKGIKPRNIGPAGMSGRVTAFGVDPRNMDIIYVGTASGGLWKTVNAGTTFTPIFDNEAVASIGALAVDPRRPDIIWAGTGEGNPRNSLTGGYGLYKSLDGGKSWNLMGLQNTRNIHRILVNPNNSDIVYVGVIGNPWAPHKERGVYKTTDGGLTWKQILFTGETCGVSDMVMDPTNPDKIFVGMWNHQRWGWFFNSGGEGSGIYVTLDGGTNFKKLSDGLPEETGRVGLAIAASRPEYVYAYVESKANAIYRSTDGGFKWEKRGEKDIGNRPFYYAEIYVDPKNENRVYTLYSGINLSEDGALTFPTVVAGKVHPDHHAFWINPENPRHIINGNDGGMSISYDMGQNWRHITTLPLGQFYHISYDMELPYNVYGGLQDNGSWRGPAYQWVNGGIRNEAWDFIIGGDGFDALPIPGDARYCYAQSQGGMVRRMDLLTGDGKSIRPNPEQGDRLRFNWNSAIAQDPFDANTIYFGSQFVHKSKNRGDSWEKISKDLTTNDPEKQKSSTSGGLTIDATGAESHCTILTISPSPINRNVIWAGTDDGNIQVTTDGGSTWSNVAANIKGLPKNPWIPQITASAYNEGEAFVVVNNYRSGDNSAYLYHTQNMGKTWVRIVDDSKVWGYVLSFVQDPVEQKLMFLGTEYNLYVSFDKGSTWNKWTSGYPTVSTYDLAIHPREHDLIIGTFGRSIWVIDDIRPMRAIAAEGSSLLSKPLAAFTPPAAVIASTKNNPGYYYAADAIYEGDNRPVAAMLSVYLASVVPDTKLSIEITDDNGSLVRSFEADVTKGVNRIEWRFDKNTPAMAGRINTQQGFGGGRGGFRMGGTVIPGNYRIKYAYGDNKAETSIDVSGDPRNPSPDFDAIKATTRKIDNLVSNINEFNKLYVKYDEAVSAIAKASEIMTSDASFADSFGKFHTTYKELQSDLDKKLNQRPDGLLMKVNQYFRIMNVTQKLNESEEKTLIGCLRGTW